MKEQQSTILFVDDEKNILKSLERLFFEEPYRILMAESGPAALMLIDSGEAPAVIVSDQRMPEMNGAAFLALAKERLPESVRVVLTGYADISVAIAAINEGGIYRYVLKPWDDEELKAVIRDAVERHRLVRHNRLLTEELKEKNQRLEELNQTLEQKVIERTAKLQQAYDENVQLTRELAAKVRELEGRDRIQQHLLTLHPLDETLRTVLEVIVTVADVDQAIIHLSRPDRPVPIAVAAAGRVNGEGCGAQPLPLDGLGERPLQRQAVQAALEQGEPVRVDAPAGPGVAPIAVVPIMKGERRLGAIEVDRHTRRGSISTEDIRIVGSFAMQAAIAISDSCITEDLPAWDSALSDMLEELAASQGERSENEPGE